MFIPSELSYLWRAVRRRDTDILLPSPASAADGGLWPRRAQTAVVSRSLNPFVSIVCLVRLVGIFCWGLMGYFGLILIELLPVGGGWGGLLAITLLLCLALIACLKRLVVGL